MRFLADRSAYVRPFHRVSADKSRFLRPSWMMPAQVARLEGVKEAGEAEREGAVLLLKRSLAWLVAPMGLATDDSYSFYNF